ncbi:MAG TPA: endonuclease MutS2 [Bryobacteraceae bacterium]|nr:endonuclease MutS2 [Bryobacteraceae bacterium]
MRTTSADVLEFESLRELVGRYIASPLGQAELEKVQPHTDRERLDEDLAEAEEATEYLRAAARPQQAARGAAIRINFSSIPDLTEAVHKLRIEGAVLEPKEIADVLTFLDRAADARSILNSVTERFPRLGRRAQSIGEFRALLNDLAGKIAPDGSVPDHASVALGRLRRDIERQKKSIQDSLERFLRAHHEEGVLQEEFVTIRNERFVVPVIAGQRRKIDGVIHGASSSGHTLFVEPLETIDLNNELVRLSEEELREVHRILRELTERLRGYADSILSTLVTMGKLDLIFAKAKFATEFDCVRPRFSPDNARRLLVKDARHPLLEDVLRHQQKRAVPISLRLDTACRTLLISGPNTGGKTVALKTVGLLTLMAQAGLPLPCGEAEFPIFERVLADIGDYQSIQQSLSTFSAHVSHLREMILDVTPDSLVLIDEIGSATDPEEGGALGVAVVDHFRASGAFTLASTHLVALKIYGANTEGVLNASMGFDETTLGPTYKLHLGLPGKSAGLDIASRLGMPEAIMRRARESLSDRERDISRFLSELHRKVEEAEARERRLEQMQAELAAREKELAHEWEKREVAKLKELERRCELVIANFEAQARETITRITQSPERKKAAEQAQRGVAKAKRELREEFETTVLATQDDARQGELGRRPKIEEGARVRLEGIREPARVRRLMGDDRIEVEAGFMKMQVRIDDVLEVLPAAETSPKLPKNVSFSPAPQFNPAAQEINVIGEHAEEACERVEKFLDSAVMATASRVRIVHGHGMGILRKAIWKLLAESPHVEKHYQAPQNEGGAGATIVELKS